MATYTKTGDKGTTSLVGGTRVSKTSERLEAYGTIDELNSHIGLLISMVGEREVCIERGTEYDVKGGLIAIQHKLFDIGAELATEPDSPYFRESISDKDVSEIEHGIDLIEIMLPRHNRFILPGGTMASAQANVARTVARRAERRIIALTEIGIAVSPNLIKYVNRLSDYLFVLSRYLNVSSGVKEIFWEK